MTDPSLRIDPSEVADMPWAMPLVIRSEKTDPAGHFATCEVAARSVVALLAAARDDPEWGPLVERWREGRIRKLARRARGVRWRNAQELPGVTVEQGIAAVRALVPGPVRPLPPALAKLQVTGTDLSVEEVRERTPAPVAVGLTPHLEMTTGKAAAQCGHAAQLAWEAMPPHERETWAATGYAVAVAPVDPARWASDPARVRVVDAGFTELDGPNETARAWW